MFNKKTMKWSKNECDYAGINGNLIKCMCKRLGIFAARDAACTNSTF